MRPNSEGLKENFMPYATADFCGRVLQKLLKVY
jgi:hypothetical protein